MVSVPVVQRRRQSAPSALPGQFRSTQSIKQKRAETVILFDWDDTLCPSSWLEKRLNGLSTEAESLSPSLQQLLCQLEIFAEKLLKSAIDMGTVMIVTNSMEPWVHVSCKRYLPSLLPLIEELPVIYTRSVVDSRKGGHHSGYPMTGVQKVSKQFGSQCADESSPQRWKEIAFHQILQRLNFHGKSVISIGDSKFERNALRHVLSSQLKSKGKCHMKTAKLFDDPSVEELIAEVRALQGTLQIMVQYEGNLDVEIQDKDLDFSYLKGFESANKVTEEVELQKTEREADRN